MPQGSTHRAPTRTSTTTNGKDGPRERGSSEHAGTPSGSRAKPPRPGPTRAAGVDVADVGDALSGALRTSAATLVWIATSVVLGVRGAATRSARALTVAWPALTHVLPRVAWWAALALLFVSGATLLDAFAPEDQLAWIPGTFVAGLALAAVPAFLARAAHLRAFGVALAAAHASALLLVWMVEAG